jgi:hypothetical protein
MVGFPAAINSLLMRVRIEPKTGAEAEVPETVICWPLAMIGYEMSVGRSINRSETEDGQYAMRVLTGAAGLDHINSNKLT